VVRIVDFVQARRRADAVGQDVSAGDNDRLVNARFGLLNMTRSTDDRISPDRVANHSGVNHQGVIESLGDTHLVVRDHFTAIRIDQVHDSVPRADCDATSVVGAEKDWKLRRELVQKRDQFADCHDATSGRR